MNYIWAKRMLLYMPFLKLFWGLTVSAFDNTAPLKPSIGRPRLTAWLRTPTPWLIWGISVAFVLFQFFLAMSSGVMTAALMKTFAMTTAGAGLLAGAFYFIYVSLQTPAGMLVDRFGPRRLLTGGGFVCALGCFLFAISSSVTMAILGRSLIGAGSAFAFISSLYLVSEWFPANRFAMMLGIAETIGMLGTILGNVYLARILQVSSWRDVMIVATIIAIAIAFLCGLFIRDRKDNNVIHQTQTIKEFFTDSKVVFSNLGLWINGIYSGFMFSIVTVFTTLWGIPYLVLADHLSLTMATVETSMTFIGVAIGSIIMGWLYPRINNKQLFLSFAAFICALIVSYLIFVQPEQLFMEGMLFFVLGIFCSSYVFNYSLANELAPKNVRSTSIGFINTLCVITAPLFQPLLGWILHLEATKSLSHHDIYTLTSYHWALSIIPLGLLIAAVLAFYIPSPSKKERHVLNDN